MARTSRNRKKEAPQAFTEKIYQVALYVRLSVIDSGKKDSDTVETQENLLRRFIKGKSYFSLFSVYIDNGETGVNFCRSEFERLMDDVKAGKVNCIIVKDLSRFGRNYIEAGEYLEKVFPFLGIRFIAVNDGYDSINPNAEDALSLHLKNLVNDVYARDISAKIAPVLRGKQERGEFIGAWAAYGYLKSKENKHRLVIDDETAPVVRDIFEWRLQGLSYQMIARRLSEHGVPSPGQYRYAKGIIKNERLGNTPWSVHNVKNILRNEVYCGHMVQGRKRESLFQGERQKMLPKEEWIIVRDTHEPIVTQAIFDAVSQINQTKKQAYEARLERFSEIVNTENTLKGLVYCGDCGTKLVRYKNVRENKNDENKFHVWYSYICPVHANDPNRCFFLSIPETTLTDVVFEAIQGQLLIAEDMEKRLKKRFGKSAAEQEKERLGCQIKQTEEALRRTRHHRESLYDDYADRLMNEHDYIYAQERYREKEAALEKQLTELTLSHQAVHDEKDEDNPWLCGMLRFRESMTLTREMAVTLIEKIIVYDKETIHIAYRFQDACQRLTEHLPLETRAAV